MIRLGACHFTVKRRKYREKNRKKRFSKVMGTTQDTRAHWLSWRICGKSLCERLHLVRAPFERRLGRQICVLNGLWKRAFFLQSLPDRADTCKRRKIRKFLWRARLLSTVIFAKKSLYRLFLPSVVLNTSSHSSESKTRINSYRNRQFSEPKTRHQTLDNDILEKVGKTRLTSCICHCNP